MNTLRETGYLKIALVGLEAAPPAESAAAGAGAPTQTASTPASGGAATP